MDIDITDLKIGSSIRISDIKNESYQFLQPENGVIIGVKTSRNVTEEEEEEEEKTEAEGSNEENKEKPEGESNDSK